MFTEEPVQDTPLNPSLGLGNKNMYAGFTYVKKLNSDKKYHNFYCFREMMLSDSMMISKIDESSEMMENPLFELNK